MEMGVTERGWDVGGRLHASVAAVEGITNTAV